MPKVYLTSEMRLRDNFAAWLYGQMKLNGESQKALARDMGLSQQGMCKKIKKQSFTFDDFVFFVKRFQPDTDTILKLTGADEWITKG